MNDTSQQGVGGLFRSTDGGLSFTAVSSGLPPGPVSSLVGDPDNPQNSYAAVAVSDQTQIYFSNDTGAT